jgi:hypothetical protein
MKQTERVRRYFLEHPGSSTWEASMDLHIANITARMSDLRKQGESFVHWTDDQGVDRYRLVIADDVQTALFFAEAS